MFEHFDEGPAGGPPVVPGCLRQCSKLDSSPLEVPRGHAPPQHDPLVTSPFHRSFHALASCDPPQAAQEDVIAAEHNNERLWNSDHYESTSWFECIDLQYIGPCTSGLSSETPFVNLHLSGVDALDQPLPQQQEQCIDPRDLEILHWPLHNSVVDPQFYACAEDNDTQDTGGLHLVRQYVDGQAPEPIFATPPPLPQLGLEKTEMTTPEPINTKPLRSRATTSAFRDWLDVNGLTSYPTREEIEGLAQAEGKTVKQAQVALSNLRARLKKKSPKLTTGLKSPGDSVASCNKRSEYSGVINLTAVDYASPYLRCAWPCPVGDSTQDSWSSVSVRQVLSTGQNISPCLHYDDQPDVESQSDTRLTQVRDASYGRKGKREYKARRARKPSAIELDSSLQGTDSSHYLSSFASPSSSQTNSSNSPSRDFTTHLSYGKPTKKCISDKDVDPIDARISSRCRGKSHHCTVCVNAGPFKTCFDWKRHEGSVHWFIDTRYVCLQDSEAEHEGICVFCAQGVDDKDHSITHDIHSCLSKPQANRTFARKDLLKQHVKQKHLAKANREVQDAFKVPDEWIKEVQSMDIDPAALWCGFCRSSFDRVADRMKHVAQHFHDGCDIEVWKPRGLE